MVAVGLRQDPPDLTHASGNAYIPVRLRAETRPGSTTRATGKIYVVNDPAKCGHVHSMCTECAKSWEIDYHVLYERSGGGRRLARMIEKAKELPGSNPGTG